MILTRKCEICGKTLEDESTHCSENCLFESVKDSKRFMPDE
jgi:predicted nucleic acid-binding Zn ribbon protein